MSIDDGTLRQIARRAAGADDNFVRLLENMLDRLDALEEMPAPIDALLAVGYMFDDDAVAANACLQPDQSIVRGQGIAVEQFTVSGTTYSGFSLEPGTYYVAITAAGDLDSDLVLSGHTAFPTTAAQITASSRRIAPIHGSTFGADLMAALIVRAATTKVWGYPPATGTNSATMFAHRLA